MEPAWVALALSLKVALWATAIDGVLGIAAGYALARYRFVGRDLVDSLLLLPMVLPPTVLGYYLLVLIGRRGPIGAWLQAHFGINLIFTWQGAVVAAAIVSFPFVCKSAAVFFRVTLPLAWRGILAGVLLAFTRALGEFGATLMVAGSIPGKTQTLSIAVYEAVQAGRDDLANRLVLIISLVAVVVLVAASRLAPVRIGTR